MNTTQIEAEALTEVEKALKILNKKLPWHLHKNLGFLSLALIVAVAFFIVFPIVSFIFHINWGELVLFFLSIGLWYTSRRLALERGDINTFYAIASGIAGAVCTVTFFIIFFGGFGGDQGPPQPAITSCKEHQGVKEYAHQDPGQNGYQGRFRPTYCNDGAHLDDAQQ